MREFLSTYRVSRIRAVLSKLVHEIVVATIRLVARVVVATPIMAHLMSKDENLFLSNEGDSPTLKTAQTGIIDDSFSLRRICKAYIQRKEF